MISFFDDEYTSRPALMRARGLDSPDCRYNETVMVVLPPEPGPPPDEGTPPQPPVVPEPYPPPDEGDPPQPARVPEPSPDPEKTE